MPKSLLLLIAAFCALAAGGQQRYSVLHYSNKDGLPANGITGLEWDPANSIFWIGTEGGLVRWDGSSFETSGETEGRVLQLGILDRAKNRFYAHCDDQSTYVMGDGRILSRRHNNSLPPKDTSLGAFFDACRAMAHSIVQSEWFVALGPSDNDFLAFRDQKVYLHDAKGGRILLDKVTYQTYFRTQGNVFLLLDSALWQFDPAARQLRRAQTPGWEASGLRFIRNDDMRSPMFYKGTGLWEMQRGTTPFEWRLRPVCNNLPTDLYPRFVRELPERGMIVLGDGINGLYVLRRNSVRQLTDTTGSIPSALLVTYAQALLPNGNIVSHCGLQYDRNGPLLLKPLPVQGSQHLSALGPYLYFSHHNFLFRFDLRTQATEQYTTLDNSGYMVHATIGDQLYVVGDRSIRRLAPNGLEELFRFPVPPPGAPPLKLYTFIESSPGMLLVGTENSVHFVDLSRKSQRVVRVSQKAAVRYLWQRPYGIFACTYGEGLFLLRNDSVYSLPRDKSGYLRFAHAIVPDGHGFCYISTNNGLFRVSEKALERAALSGEAVYYHYLGKEDGLAQTELNGGCMPACLQLPGGTLSFPTINGLAQLHPDSVHIAAPTGTILVRALADGQAIDRFPHRFSSDTKFFQFDVTMPFWGSPENLYGWYRLRRSGEPANEQGWIRFDPSHQRQFSFTALKPDTYVFEVRTFNGFGTGDFALRTFQFEVARPWWATGRAILLWMTLLFALLWLAIYLRTRQLRARSAQLEATVLHRTRQIEQQKGELAEQLQLVSEAHDLKERLVSVISHNIITPLRYIHRATTMMREDARSLDPALREKAVDSIKDTSLELELLSVNLLNWIRLQHKQVRLEPESFSFGEIAEHVYGLLGAVAKGKGQTIVVEPADLHFYQYKDALQVIVYNLVLNAISHSGGDSTILSCRKEGPVFLLSVEDNGNGIPEPLRRKLFGGNSASALKETDNQGTGFGFIIINDLVRLIGGQLEWEDRAPGTRITIRFAHLESGVNEA